MFCSSKEYAVPKLPAQVKSGFGRNNLECSRLPLESELRRFTLHDIFQLKRCLLLSQFDLVLLRWLRVPAGAAKRGPCLLSAQLKVIKVVDCNSLRCHRFCTLTRAIHDVGGAGCKITRSHEFSCVNACDPAFTKRQLVAYPFCTSTPAINMARGLRKEDSRFFRISLHTAGPPPPPRRVTATPSASCVVTVCVSNFCSFLFLPRLLGVISLYNPSRQSL